MHFLNLTLRSAAENLSLDEALLEQAERSGQPGEVLRLWEPASLMVVLGSSSRAADEVKLDECKKNRVPVLRRPSGGATILTGPGCLMYAVVLSYESRPELRSIDRAHRFVLDTISAALQQHLNFPSLSPLGRGQGEGVPAATTIRRSGTSDLTLHNQKFSGNSLRCKRTHLLYHGTLLYNFQLDQVEKFLGSPSRQPEYRAGRNHRDFICNLPFPATTLRTSLIDAFRADTILPDWPQELTAALVQDRYGRDDWNLRL